MTSQPYTLFSNQALRNLLIPLIIEQALFITVGAADSIMVASLGEASVSAVSMVDMFNGFIGNVFFALSTGGAVVAAQALGAKNKALARESALQLLIISAIFAVGVTALVEIFNHSTLRLLFGKLEQDVMDQSVTYFTITALAFPFIAIYGSCAAIFRSQNMAKLTMQVSLICNVINVIGNAILIFVFHMGVAGAAYSTLISRIAAMSIILAKLTNPELEISVALKKSWKLSRKIVGKILYIGIPSGVENGIFQLGRVLVLGLIAKYGTSEIAANAVATQPDYFSCIIGGAFSLAMITVIGQCVGAGDEGQLRYYLKKMMTWTYAAHIVWNIILFALLPLIMLCYSNIQPETIRMGVILVVIHNGFGLIMWPASFVFPNALRAMNDVKFTMITSISSMLIIRLGFSYLLAPIVQSGAIAVWIAMIADWLVRIICFTWRYKSNAWRKYAWKQIG